MVQLRWQKSSYSEGGADTCVEIAAALNASRAYLRESATPETVIAATSAALHALIGGIKGETLGLASRRTG
ncbi:DUF397 domain-containing protein [Streptomyces sp. CA-210063]|uniref:DUF397 domain-containing protein n=1 Tax=Streptomyces sp. CA-210063 TaxID=2801029 RepID=UPI00214BB72D|nr:DUF397 domain-containing protein [Streptomyces sp. CA-210063]UUU31105.1 DUF397 domain-containing protein [Streptomyces sp. CA-210063]